MDSDIIIALPRESLDSADHSVEQSLNSPHVVQCRTKHSAGGADARERERGRGGWCTHTSAKGLAKKKGARE